MVYEGMTYEVLLNRMMDRVTASYPNIDTREGSMIFNALAPEAMELAIAYTELDNIRNESFIETASRDGKLKLCQDQGIDTTIFDATHGVFKGEFNVQVELGSRWNLDLYNYTVTEFIKKRDESHYEYKLTCETDGAAPNGVFGDLTPIADVPSGLTLATLTELLVEGEQEAMDTEIVDYYLSKINGTATDGNVAQYKRWCSEYNGIGNFKIFPLWKGNNTVKVSILTTSNKAASSGLIKEFQTYLDPNTTGMGDGKAPIGAFVTVTTAKEIPINISAKITLASGYDDADEAKVQLGEYLASIAYNKSTISYMAIGATILNSPCVDNVTGLLVNGKTADITLGDEEIPKLGTVNWT